MEEVYIYNGKTESELEQELEEASLECENAEKDYIRRKRIFGVSFGGALFNLVCLGTVVLIKDLRVPPYYILYGGNTLLWGKVSKHHYKRLKSEKQNVKELKIKRKSLQEKMPIEVEYIVK